ncbi:hypothetical protein [Polyangium sorediatum]|uniref:Outer membrane protein beta-barrel domain-containing protein n=1 Tax=Polyangium sorediatum TaxID=889274 RepID=A0ABT6P8G8_9BACT|nr:hypothetical protein [Polyangium sorediatum]MDI1436882.1 hypothetical protein [Polyangium sorediatum]
MHEGRRFIGGAAGALTLACILTGTEVAQAGDPSHVALWRFEMHGAYFQGDQRLGAGTLAPYNGWGFWGRVGISEFPWKWLGYDVLAQIGLVGTPQGTFDVAAEGAVAFAPARWKGSVDGSIVLGVGGGFGLERPVWLGRGGTGYPLLLGRLTLKPKNSIRFFTSFRFTPITSDAGWVRSYDLEVAGGYKWWHLGLRGRIDDVTQGDPERLYRTYWLGPTAGLVIR